MKFYCIFVRIAGFCHLFDKKFSLYTLTYLSHNQTVRSIPADLTAKQEGLKSLVERIRKERNSLA